MNTRVCVQVHAGWVLDTEVYNEWMNEEDYLVDDRNVPLILRRRVHVTDQQVCVCMCEILWLWASCVLVVCVLLSLCLFLTGLCEHFLSWYIYHHLSLPPPSLSSSIRTVSLLQ